MNRVVLASPVIAGNKHLLLLPQRILEQPLVVGVANAETGTGGGTDSGQAREEEEEEESHLINLKRSI